MCVGVCSAQARSQGGTHRPSLIQLPLIVAQVTQELPAHTHTHTHIRARARTTRRKMPNSRHNHTHAQNTSTRPRCPPLKQRRHVHTHESFHSSSSSTVAYPTGSAIDGCRTTYFSSPKDIN